MKLDNFSQKLISWLFAGMFFLVPLFFTSVNSELFEFNKIVLIYAFTTIIIGVWFARMILAGRIFFKRTFFDIPLLLFLASQVVSTIFSIDRHTSIFGYYSRFNGGLLSAICYLLLYWAFVSNCEAKDVHRAIKVSLASAAIISIYGILEHFGYSFSCLMFMGKFDVSCWIQKVQERVFATLGQPNWLAAYLVALVPLTWHLVLNLNYESRIKNQGGNITKTIIYYLLFIILFLCLLFTQSRSGFLGFVLSFVAFWAILFIIQKGSRKALLKPFLTFNFALLTLIFLFGTPFPQINKFLYFKSFISLVSPHKPPSQPNTSTSLSAGQRLTTKNSPLPITFSEDGGISTSSDIRKIVWKGAIDIFKHYPLFGSGVETFAYAYYNLRPVEHNLVSEWDFLYNKAHNEYLNYLSTTGIFGLGTYLIFISVFITWSVIQFKVQSSKCKVEMQNSKLEKQKLLTYNCNFELLILNFSLLSGWLSLLVTNFFGFSVVITSLYFFLIPAFCIVLTSRFSLLNPAPHLSPPTSQTTSRLSPSPLLLAPLFAICYLLFAIFNIWRADFFYAQGQKLSKKSEYPEAYQAFYKAKNFFPNEPVYLSELASVTANLALLSNSEKNASATGELMDLAIYYSDQAEKISPKNLNILKTRVKVFYTLSLIKENYLQNAIDTTIQATRLAPTDPKLVYNLGLLYAKTGDVKLTIQTVKKAVELKPNYVDARNALALFYEDAGQKDKALEQLEILINLAPENKEEFQKKIDKLK